VRVTAVARAALAAVVRPGDVALDATAGNGKDTLVLAKRVGPTGRVFAFDVQQSALDQTASALAAAGLLNTTLVLGDHALVRETIPPEFHGRLAVAVFNLGYLPGGDKGIVTRADSSRAALLAAAELLRPGGLLTVTVYPGHSEGAEEAATVAELLSRWKELGWHVVETAAAWPGAKLGPHLWTATKPTTSA